MAKKRNGLAPMTIYPDDDVRRAMADIGKDDHGRPASHVAVLAMKAYAVLWGKDRYEALKLADSFKR